MYRQGAGLIMIGPIKSMVRGRDRISTVVWDHSFTLVTLVKYKLGTDRDHVLGLNALPPHVNLTLSQHQRS